MPVFFVFSTSSRMPRECEATSTATPPPPPPSLLSPFFKVFEIAPNL